MKAITSTTEISPVFCCRPTLMNILSYKRHHSDEILYSDCKSVQGVIPECCLRFTKCIPNSTE